MIDRYTKSVLTVIAAALTILVVQNATRSSQAYQHEKIQKVQICNQTDCASLGLVFNEIGMQSHALKVVAHQP